MDETRKNIISRKAAREFVVGLLFAKSFAPNDDTDEFFAREVLNADVSMNEHSDYIREAFFGVCDGAEALDEKIKSAAAGWNLSRLSKMTLSIMRLAIYEMSSIDDVPKRVALNEAIELAKKYDDDKAPAFINGVLNNVAGSLPDRECDK